jgi:uncharacterized protein YeaO (DUF488 family)
MPIRTRRWNDPEQPGDGVRILVCRYRPRGLPKGEETWDEWRKQLAPSAELLADFHGKRGAPISWETYRKRYLAEMKQQSDAIRDLAERSAGGETITLLCSSACTDPQHCHRTLLQGLIESQRRRDAPGESFIERHAPSGRRRRARVP